MTMMGLMGNRPYACCAAAFVIATVAAAGVAGGAIRMTHFVGFIVWKDWFGQSKNIARQ